MRIIAGSHRGKKLVEYYAPKTRPTTDRVKENVFNLLANYVDFNGLRVLDLFAGTGAYGIECLSRGASFVHFNDTDSMAISVIKKNLGQIWQNYRVTKKDYLNAIGGDYDVIFLDPPYASDYGEKAIDVIQSGLIVFETDHEFEHAQIIDSRRYGRTWIYLIKKP
ncbi:MAG: RsmD family RNA methyltransferase [Clostridia bacterium]|nr:RsmD family RNA methyltransferase [Clostridia bacterium]